MSIYDLDRIQEAGAWVETIRPLPVDEIADELIKRAQAVVAAEPEGPLRRHNEERLQLTLDPEALEKYKQRRAETVLVLEVESWLEGQDRPSDEETEEEVDYFEQERRDERKAQLSRWRASSLLFEVTELLDRAEVGVNDPNHGSWIDADTMDSVRHAIKLQNELGLPVVSDRIRELTVRGINAPFNGYAARLLTRQAIKYGDYQDFIAAGRKYQSAVQEFQDTADCEQSMVEAATTFIATKQSEGLDREALNFAFNALAHFDPVSTFYPLACARLGIVLRSFKD
jgi:hypothetical protein